ncbi:O-linked N-acetylglucosamine transferase, SPINDLY family protein [Leptolyngbya sp. FACHB-671]|uniref:O-linked N-acetylglucosamine transferase, SPINDLY family protein n=1 Tax=Leptolyngbya sp. FACHB-671 TaxID=2692812 RepID=UPI001683C682|nr:O-linked N-acetylglucosamine transferase, SPINDLY family protein [Leptolyngbya sp. FACHB-671]MBD2069875.1 O-linked N-acetylglucosamine transferase, SPINDLY family protein [Leptolyngbya sp. FACHB-671]
MNVESSALSSSAQQQQAYQALVQGNYTKAASLFEQLIDIEPEVRLNYWYLGLSMLLQGQEVEAQTTWMLALSEGEPEQIEQWSAELATVLQVEAERQEQLEENALAWTIRQHLREVNPGNAENLLKILQLSVKLKTFNNETLVGSGIIDLLRSHPVELDLSLLYQTITDILNYAPLEPAVLEFLEVCSPPAPYAQGFIDTLIPPAVKLAYSEGQPLLAARLMELCLRLDPQHLEVLKQLSAFYQSAHQFEKGIETARICYRFSKTLPDQIYASYLILRGLMLAGGRWEEAESIIQQQEELVRSLLQENPTSFKQIEARRLVGTLFSQPYFRDDLAQNRLMQNQVMRLLQDNVEQYAFSYVEQFRQRTVAKSVSSPKKRLKIGYLSHCFKTHSVGWLARWLLKHHDREQFEIHAYFIGYKSQGFDPLQEWYVKQVEHAHKLPAESFAIAQQIHQDEIDILIDLDSITLDTTCEIMALKPAPVQATWLGWDASGIPAIDYFIADPYVLPDSAQAHYSEKIWRLPQTYIAVDGFEIGIPSLQRDDLGIADDAVVYLSAQRGHKRHPDTVRLQMQIVKAVPNSYFLIKGLSDADAIQKLFVQIAAEEGVERSRLRFLPEAPSESVHRANLAIADVVLDTYPYNGATTTLETLWMGIPLVTRVGEQFAARNSYTMMVNAGITEGIAWTDEEYVEWGIRLGTDTTLRQTVKWNLWRSRQIAPLWNAKQFTRDMENAYQQMWSNFISSN